MAERFFLIKFFFSPLRFIYFSREGEGAEGERIQGHSGLSGEPVAGLLGGGGASSGP